MNNIRYTLKHNQVIIWQGVGYYRFNGKKLQWVKISDKDDLTKGLCKIFDYVNTTEFKNKRKEG